jgi:glycosyltransferase involved in cell wall biosynthesis
MSTDRGAGLLAQVTPLVITFNEAANIERTLSRLAWARRIVVVDSGSTDETLAIVRGFPQAEVIQRPFDSFARQCNFGLAQIRTEWALSLDADYELSDALVREMAALDPEAADGYQARFAYRVWGRPLRGALYPPRTVLYRVAAARYADEGHGHRVSVSGKVRPLNGVIYHDDRKPLARWLDSQKRYAHAEARHLLAAAPAELSGRDRVRRMAWPAPLLVFAYVLVVKGCLLDGWPGWFYALQRLLAEVMIALEVIDQRMTPPSPAAPRP